MHRHINILGFICITLLTGRAAAADFQPHASIHDAARLFIQNHVKSTYDQQPDIHSGKLDSRLNLRMCEKPLEAYLPQGSNGIGKITVGVKCTDQKPWSLYVPVTVSLFKDVLVAKENLARGSLLEISDLKSVRYDLARLPNGYISEPGDTVGMTLKRPLAAGAPLTPSIIEKPRIITRGQRVTILARSGGMAVRTSGKALAHGAAGERIGVMNTKSKMKLEGIITASGEVEVDI